MADLHGPHHGLQAVADLQAVVDLGGVHGDHPFHAELPGHVHRHVVHVGAVGEQGTVAAQRRQDAGQGRAGIDQFRRRTLAQHHAPAGAQLGGDHRHRDVTFLQTAIQGQARQQGLALLETAAAHPPAQEHVAQGPLRSQQGADALPQIAAGGHRGFGKIAGVHVHQGPVPVTIEGIGGGHDGAHGHPDDGRRPPAVVDQALQHPGMGQAPDTAAGEHQGEAAMCRFHVPAAPRSHTFFMSAAPRPCPRACRGKTVRRPDPPCRIRRTIAVRCRTGSPDGRTHCRRGRRRVVRPGTNPGRHSPHRPGAGRRIDWHRPG